MGLDDRHALRLLQKGRQAQGGKRDAARLLRSSTNPPRTTAASVRLAALWFLGRGTPGKPALRESLAADVKRNPWWPTLGILGRSVLW